MAIITKLGRMVTYDWEKLTHNIRWSSDHVIIRGHVTNRKLRMTTKHSRLVTCGERNPPMKSHDSLTAWCCVVTWEIKSVVSYLDRPATMKLDKLVTYGEVNTPIKSNVPLTTWSHEVTWQTKNKLFLPPEDKFPPNFAGCWYIVRQSASSTRTVPPDLAGWSRVVTGSHSWSHRTLWLVDYAVLWGHMKNLKRNISSSTRPRVPSLPSEWGLMTIETGGHRTS